MAFTLPDLPYAHDALAAAGMSKETLEYHHDIHHKASVDNGNKLIAGTEWENKSLEDIVKGTYQSGAVAQNGIFNNASQHWNHSQFWEMMYEAADTGITVFVTTHYMDEAEYCNRVSIMVDGRIDALDTPKNLKDIYQAESMDEVFRKLARKATRVDN